MNSTRVHGVQRQVTEQATEGVHDLAVYATEPTADSDIEADGEFLIFDSFYYSGGMN